MAKFLLAQLSDTHVRADDGGASVAAVKRALADARAHGAHAIVITGDLVNDERADEYVALAEALAAPPAPVYVLPGNHDDRALLQAALPDHVYLPRGDNLSFTVDAWPLRLVALDQIVPGRTHGEFTPELAHWLDRALTAAPAQPTLVALHHPPFPTHDLLFNRIGLFEPERFADVIARHPQVKRIVCGHHHRFAVGQVAHAPAIVAPSIAWSFGLALREGEPLAPKLPTETGWVLHVWDGEAGLASHCMGFSA